ncbi:MAG: protein kinase [Myxococcota bacterium]|nr:protein kinase [Myxococcota bacterium]
MENLEGGLIALEHRYEVGAIFRRIGHEYIYEGHRDPFDKKVWIHIFELDAPRHVQLAITERLRRSAQSTSQLDNAALLSAIDYGELEEGVPFVITERCEGNSLQQILDRDGTLSPEECAQLIERVANLLGPLHRQERYHGSIAPGWIFLPEDDPNLARLGHFELGLDITEQRSLSTPTLSPQSLSPLPPEAFADAEARIAADAMVSEPTFSRAGDIYALGALAYTCLVGFHPFFQDEEDPSAGMIQLQQDPRALTELGIDEEISEIVQRALTAEPDARWSSARAFAAALKRAVGLDLIEEPSKKTAHNSPTPSTLTPANPAQAGSRRRQDLTNEETIPAPDRRSAITGGALLFALLTNIAWAMFALSPSTKDTNNASTPETTPSATAATTVKIDNNPIMLESNPGKAKLMRVTPEGDEPLGETPFPLDPSLAGEETLRLRVTKPGYRDLLFEVQSHTDAQNLRILLEKRD